ncbi:MAG: hypothetical protein AB203_00285 [Parcubacteria bacterium C7867-008]|nr:MAG: hypothetical protein AB203_00285 [Parcubacteria bacterium C7867-008]
MKPLVLYGRAEGTGGIRLAFQIVDPVYKIPMVWEVVTASFRDGKFLRGYSRYLHGQGEKIPELFKGLDGTAGIERVWVGPTFIVVFGEQKQFPAIAARIQEVMTIVPGDFDFEDVGKDNHELGLIGVHLQKPA